MCQCRDTRAGPRSGLPSTSMIIQPFSLGKTHGQGDTGSTMALTQLCADRASSRSAITYSDRFRDTSGMEDSRSHRGVPLLSSLAFDGGARSGRDKVPATTCASGEFTGRAMLKSRRNPEPGPPGSARARSRAGTRRVSPHPEEPAARSKVPTRRETFRALHPH